MSVTLIAGPRIVFGCETAFNEQVIAECTQETESTLRKEGLYSSKITVTETFTTGVAGSKAIASMDMSYATQIRFWIRSTKSVNANDLQFLLDNTANCASPLNTLDIGALTANTWSQQTLNLVTPANLTAVISLGLKIAVDQNAAFSVYLDKIELVSESRTFNELSVVGFDNPENEEGFPAAEAEQLLDGSWTKTPPVATTRSIFLDLEVNQYSIAEQVFLRNFQFAENQQMTYGGETLSVVSTMNSFPVTRDGGIKLSRHYTFELKEKTARLIGSANPTSWA